MCTVLKGIFVQLYVTAMLSRINTYNTTQFIGFLVNQATFAGVMAVA